MHDCELEPARGQTSRGCRGVGPVKTKAQTLIWRQKVEDLEHLGFGMYSPAKNREGNLQKIEYYLKV